MEHVIRPVRAEEWFKVKELRLLALQDPVANIAFLETYADADARPDSFWQDRARGASHGGAARQFIAETPDGEWAGTVVVLVEPAGTESVFGDWVPISQGHLVAVFVRPEFRGTGLTEELFRTALEWAWSVQEPKLERVHLFVHEANGRAAAFYRKMGFVPTGDSVLAPGDKGERELEMAVDRPA
ncbi:GNAT family N-acetyltransferase [Streptomyces sp. NPDC051322]|uniref:GNAT family N-acetyltransferase n=1 Tax=Streptomyces sp. NPDC051322 TaxID=3154645 RepID=UPI00344FE772